MKAEAIRVIRICSVLLALGLSACGGGGSSTCNSGIATLCDTLGVSSAAPGVTTPAAGQGSLQLSLSDASGVSTTSVASSQSGILRALVKDSSGVAAPNVAVTFTTTDATGVFVPSSGTALSDSNGLAQLGLSAGSQAGAFTATANSSVGGKSVAGSVSYSVIFPILSLSAFSVTPQPLSARGIASVSLTVLNGTTAYTPPLAVAFASPCATAGKAVIGSPVQTQNGVATASYTDKGCGVADIITASVAYGGTTVTQTGTITVLPAAAGSIKFVSADTTNIALKGTGGFGRQEFSTLKYQVLDTTGNPVSGKSVDFVFADSNTASTLGGLTLNPASATSAADGSVTTLVTAGTVPTSVRVVATIHGTTLTTLSNILVISTGVPDQKHFSLATEAGNCEGWDFDQPCSVVTATLGDHFGNPAPDGTAVNFTTESGVIGASCVTGSLPPPGATPAGQTTNSSVGPGSGTCSVTLRSSGVRPVDGRVTVLAYAMGEEDFVDNNGNNVFDAGDTFIDKSPDIFRNDDESGVITVANPNGTWTAGEPCIGPNSNGTCSTPGDGQYNGVLISPQVKSAQTLYVSKQLVQLFSGGHAVMTFSPAALTCPANGTTDVQVTVSDDRGNFMPARTTIAFSSQFGSNPGIVLPRNFIVPNVVLGLRDRPIVPTYTATLGCPASGSGKFLVTVTTPNGVQTVGAAAVTTVVGP